MAGSVNKVFLMGNLTRDIELKHTPSDQSVATIGLAVNRTYKSREGEKREETTFVDCEAWGRTGKKRSKLLVVIENFQFVDSRGGGGGGQPAPTGAVAHQGGGTDHPPVAESDIPF